MCDATPRGDRDRGPRTASLTHQKEERPHPLSTGGDVSREGDFRGRRGGRGQRRRWHRVVFDDLDDLVLRRGVKQRRDDDVGDVVARDLARVERVLLGDFERARRRLRLEPAGAHDGVLQTRAAEVLFGLDLLVEDVAEGVGDLEPGRVLLSPRAPVRQDRRDHHDRGHLRLDRGVDELDGAEVVDGVRGGVHLERVARDEARGDDEGVEARERLGDRVDGVLDDVEPSEIDRRDRVDFLHHRAAHRDRARRKRGRRLVDVAHAAGDRDAVDLREAIDDASSRLPRRAGDENFRRGGRRRRSCSREQLGRRRAGEHGAGQ
mmetsp:Transcript_22863/g.90672  ORF Transcript_22863/g.90672 Transcript_22863/m.90672 type:complete len:320 (-) Transcript_22863:234-1193(-)